MIEASNLTRAQLRRTLRKTRRELPRAAQRKAATALYRQLAQHPIFRRARLSLITHLTLPTNREV